MNFKDIKSLMADLKLVYGAETKDLAKLRLCEFGEKWDKKYPQISKIWLANLYFCSRFGRFRKSQ